MESESWDLVYRFQAGDKEAFGKIWSMHHPGVYRYLVSLTRDPFFAEDLASDVFVRALGAMERLRYQGSDVGAWFTTIARNVWIDKSRKLSRAPCISLECFGDKWDQWAVTDTDITLKEDVNQLMAAIRELTPPQKQVIFHRFFECLSIQETSELMGKPVNAIKSLTSRATRKLEEVTGRGKGGSYGEE